MRRLGANFLISLAALLIAGVGAAKGESAQSTIKSANVAYERTIFYNNSDRSNFRATELSLFLEFHELENFQVFLTQRMLRDPDGNSHRDPKLKGEDFKNELVLGAGLKRVKKIKERLDLRLRVAAGLTLAENGELEDFVPEPNPEIRDKIAQAEVGGAAIYSLRDDLELFGQMDIVGFYSKDKKDDVEGFRHVVFSLALGGELKFSERFFFKAALETSMQHDNHWDDSQLENWRAVFGLSADF